jgi:hypothetical protein
VIDVPAGASLQAALNAARPGDTLVLAAGATYTGPFTLPNKPGAGWITVRGSRDAELPAAARVGAAQSALLPRLTAAGVPVLTTAPSAHHFRLVGLEIAPAGALPTDLVRLGDGSSAQNSLALVPHDLLIDRCYLHGNPGQALKRGIALNAAAVTVSGCTISEVKGVGYDTQALCGWNGPGPFTLVNNQLEAAGEVVMFGGADPSIANLVPSDITLTGCTLTRPLSWRGVWTVKNLFELKNARRIVVDGNRLENNWGDAQTGFAVLMKSVNQDGTAPWSETAQVTFTHNVVRHSGSALALLGTPADQPGVPMHQVTISDNLFEDINGSAWRGAGIFLSLSGVADLTVAHNTVLNSGTAMVLSGPPSARLVVQNNLFSRGPYGIKGDGTGEGTASLATYAPGAVFNGNGIVGANAALYPAGNFFPATVAAVGFSDPAGGNYQLLATSPYRGRGTDGTDPGVTASRLPGTRRRRR